MEHSEEKTATTATEARDDLRVVVVGGAGGMGRWAVRTAAELPSVRRLVVADLNLERARAVASSLGPHVVAEQMDVTDAQQMARVFGEADVVLNTMGPFATFGTPVLRAALEAGCHYLDIDDDWESTLEAPGFDVVARERGLAAVIGLGASPGVSNMLAVKAVQHLDVVETLITGWRLSGARVEQEEGDESSPSAALAHWLGQSAGTIRTWEGGAWADPAPLQPVKIEYPGIEPQVAFTCGHPEPLTIAPNLGVTATAWNVMTGPTWIFEALRGVADRYVAGEVTLDEAAGVLDEARAQSPRAGRDPLPGVWALATGTSDSRRLRVAVQLTRRAPGLMGGATGIPLAVGLDLFAQGRVRDIGVLAPEQAFDADDFFESYEQHLLPGAEADVPLLQVDIEEL